MSFLFKYDTFYKFYSNLSNLLEDDSPRPIVKFYRYDSLPRGQLPESDQLPKHYMEIMGSRVYIRINSKKRSLMFVVPKLIGDTLWDFHYHFGLRTIHGRPNGNNTMDVIYFHKTYQDPIKQGKTHKRCFFADKSLFEDIRQIMCQEKKSGTMANEFTDIEDLQIISEIISIPFVGQRHRFISGMRGGCYVIKSGRKVYVSKKNKATQRKRSRQT